jgi:cation diffusion facilitator CzcD-associated flavoprotein CzcO
MPALTSRSNADAPVIAPTRRTFALIVGSGFSGLAMAIALKKAGLDDLVILERGDAIGGTWRDNTYPGCACDVPSHLYSFSFELNPRWSRSYATQPEIRAYMEHCTDKYDVRRHVELHQNVTACDFDETTGEWTVTTARGDTFVSTIVVLAVGGLSNPAFPNIAGRETFAGPSFHSAQWRHDVDLAGQRVGVIGTGASAVQFVPKIAPIVKELTLFQRTPPWVLPRPDRAFTEAEMARFARFPAVQRLYRSGLYTMHEAVLAAFVGDQRLLLPAQRRAKRHMESAVRDPARREQLLPRYTMGCKRVLTSNEYYPALARENVSIETHAITSIDESSVHTRDGGRHEVDVLIWGTGFAVHEYLGGLPIRGVGGRSLHDGWTRGAEAYLGTTIAGFPNCFALLGPNVGLGHNSIIFMIEAQVKHAMDVIRRLRESGARWIDVRESTMRAFNDELQSRFRGSVWSTGCASWYLDENGKNTTIWPASTAEFWARTRRFQPDAYRLAEPLSPTTTAQKEITLTNEASRNAEVSP